MNNDNFTDEEKKNQQDAVSKLMKMIAAARAIDTGDSTINAMHMATAKRYKTMYDNYVAVGFTREEAFELLKIEVRSMNDFVANSRLK